MVLQCCSTCANDGERTTQLCRPELMGTTRTGTERSASRLHTILWLSAAGGTGRLLAGQRERDFDLGLPRLGLGGIHAKNN